MSRNWPELKIGAAKLDDGESKLEAKTKNKMQVDGLSLALEAKAKNKMQVDSLSLAFETSNSFNSAHMLAWN